MTGTNLTRSRVMYSKLKHRLRLLGQNDTVESVIAISDSYGRSAYFEAKV